MQDFARLFICKAHKLVIGLAPKVGLHVIEHQKFRSTGMHLCSTGAQREGVDKQLRSHRLSASSSSSSSSSPLPTNIFTPLSSSIDSVAGLTGINVLAFVYL